MRAADVTLPARIPPHDLDAERAILGAVLYAELDDDTDRERIVDTLRAHDFYTEAHCTIYSAMLAVRARGGPPDAVTVGHALRDAGHFDDQACKAAWLAIADPLVASIPSHVDGYSRIVREAAAKREAIAHAARLIAGAYDGVPAGDLVALADEIRQYLQAPAAEPATPRLVREGLDLVLTLAGDVRMALTAIRVTKRGVEGELTIRQAERTVHWGALNLASGTARDALVRRLREAAPGVPWREHLEEACTRLTAAAREGEPITALTGDAPLATPDLVAPLVLEGQTTTVFADGDSGKSLLAVAIAVAMTTGRALPGGIRPRRPGPVMVLDWETDRGQWDGRLAGLCAGLGLDVPEDAIHYRSMTAALTDDVTMLAAEATRRHVGLVIVDSLAPACGPEPDGADAVVRTLNALRLFAPAARLVLAHVSKHDADRREGARPFGSVFVWNLSRSVWEIRRDPEPAEPGLTMALHHRKCNVGPRHAPLGLRFVFGPDTITPYPIDLAAAPQLTRGVSLAWRIRTTLAGGRMTVAALAETLEAEPETVARTLRRLRHEGKVVDLGDGAWGLKA